MHFVGLWVHGQVWAGVVELEVALANIAHVFTGREGAVQPQFLANARIQRGLADKAQASGTGGPAQRPEHHAVVHRLGRGDGGVGVAHGSRCNHPTFHNERGFYTKEGRVPQHQVRQLAHFHGTHFVRNAVGNRGVDGVLGDVAFGAQVVRTQWFVVRQQAALHFHLVGGLPGATHHFPYPPHGLGVGGDHGDHAHVLEDVFRGDGLAANTRICEGHVFRDVGVQVVADHQHVEVFVDGVDGVRPCGIGGGRQYVVLGAGGDDIGGMAAAGPFGVIGVDAPAFERGEGVFHKPGFVEGVGVDGDLYVELVRYGEAVVDGSGCSAPVFVEFEAHGAGFDLQFQGFRQAGVAFAEEADVHGHVVDGLEHFADVPGAGCAGGGVAARGRTGAAA